jgi:hypothetical protein
MAIFFDEVDDYYDISDAAELVLQDGDWCVSIWSKVDDNSGAIAQYLLSNNNLGATDSINLWLEESGSGSSPNEWSFYGRDSDGTNTGTFRCGATGADSTWRLIIIQRRIADNEVQIWFCEQNGAASKVAFIADTNFDAVDGGDWNIARRVDGNADRYYGGAVCELFKGNFSLSQAQIETLAAGTTISDLAADEGYTLDLYLPMWTADATLTDESGSGNDATRHGAPVTVAHPSVFTPTPQTFTSYTPRSGPTLYSVWLLSPTRIPIALIDRVIRLQLTLTTNTIGVAQLTLPATFPISWIQEDSGLLIWRKVPGGQKYVEGETAWLIRDWDQILTERGEQLISLLAYTANEQLDRAIVDYAASTAYASKTDYIDDMMKALIRENLGSLATDSDRDFSSWLTVEDDASAGPSRSKAFSWRNVYAVLRELAQDADDQGNPVFFDVVHVPGQQTFEFRTYIGQRGIDLSSTGAKQVVLSPRNGTLSNVRRSYVSSVERNAVTVGGKGEGEDREVERATDDTRIAISPINRRELFVDARNTAEGDTAALQAEAATALKNHRPRETFSAKIRDTQAIRYGREYGFGCRVIAELLGRTVDCRLDSVTILVERGNEDIRAELRVDE